MQETWKMHRRTATERELLSTRWSAAEPRHDGHTDLEMRMYAGGRGSRAAATAAAAEDAIEDGRLRT